MGLDIYVHWKDMTEAEHDAQITGFSDAPFAGYMRFNWAGVGFMREYSKAHGLINVITATYPNWEGSNGEEISVGRDTLARLLSLQNDLNAYLEEHPEPNESDDDAYYYHRKVVNWVEFIHFIVQHADKPELTIVYG